MVLAGIMAGFGPTRDAIFSYSTPQRTTYSDDLNDLAQLLMKNCKVAGKPAVGEFGIYGAPSSPFSLTFEVPLEPGEVPLIQTWSPRPPQVEGLVTFRLAGEEEQLLVPASVKDELVHPQHLTPAKSHEVAQVTLSFSVPAEAPSPILVLDKINIGARVFGKGYVQPEAWLMFPVMFLPSLLGYLFYLYGTARRKTWIVILVCGAVISAAAAASTDLILIAGVIYALLYVGLLGFGISKGYAGPAVIIAPPSDASRVLSLFTCVALLTAVLIPRWQMLVQLADSALMADTVHYYTIARGMKHPLGTAPREPLHMNLMWLFCTLTSWSTIAVRLYTLIVSLMEGLVLFAVSRYMLGYYASCAVVLLYAFNPLLVQSAPQGLREELFPALALLLVWFTYRLTADPLAVKRHVAPALSGAALVLTRVSGALLFPALYVLALWDHRGSFRQWRRFMVPAAFAFVIPAGAMFIAHKLSTGDALVSNSIVAKFYANQEFAGTSGFPTRAEVEANAFAGPPISMGQYMFKHHTLAEVTSATAAGMYRMLVGDVAQHSLLRVGTSVPRDTSLDEVPRAVYEYGLYLAYLVGLVYCLRIRHGQMLVVTLIAIQLPLAFLAGRNLAHVRLLMNGTPLMLLIAVHGIVCLCTWARRLTPGNNLVKPAGPGSGNRR
jgi:hypothetical protein